jgi:cell division protein FtsB
VLSDYGEALLKAVWTLLGAIGTILTWVLLYFVIGFALPLWTAIALAVVFLMTGQAIAFHHVWTEKKGAEADLTNMTLNRDKLQAEQQVDRHQITGLQAEVAALKAQKSVPPSIVIYNNLNVRVLGDPLNALPPAAQPPPALPPTVGPASSASTEPPEPPVNDASNNESNAGN